MTDQSRHFKVLKPSMIDSVVAWGVGWTNLRLGETFVWMASVKMQCVIVVLYVTLHSWGDWANKCVWEGLSCL